MASFHYFLLVTTLLPFALGGDNLNCSKIIKREEICCDGDVYSIVEPIWPEESCNVEPKNETLTFADSAWLAFDCNVRQRLNSTGLTPKSYLNLLLRARNSSQSQFWETLKFQSENSKETLGDDEYDKIQAIKLYHRESFQTLEQICSFGDGIPTSGKAHFNFAPTKFTTRFSRMQYSRECNNETLPYAGYFAATGYSNEGYENSKKCEHEFNQTLGNPTYHKFFNSISMLCRSIGSESFDIKPHIVRPTLDFEGIVMGLSPTFWSKSVKISVKNYILEELKRYFKTEDLDDVESLMRNKIEKKFSQELTAGESQANKHEFVQTMMIIQISELFQFCARNICKFDASRKENARL